MVPRPPPRSPHRPNPPSCPRSQTRSPNAHGGQPDRSLMSPCLPWFDDAGDLASPCQPPGLQGTIPHSAFAAAPTSMPAGKCGCNPDIAYVVSTASATISREVSSVLQVGEVKRIIESAQGKNVYPADQQMLICQGKILKDDTTLESSNVAENSFLVIMLSKAKASSSGASTPSKAPLTQVGEVKRIIESAQGKNVYPADQQMLICQGKILKDDTTLESSNVAENSFLVIMLSKAKASSSGASTPSKAPLTQSSSVAACTPSIHVASAARSPPSQAHVASSKPAPPSAQPSAAPAAATFCESLLAMARRGAPPRVRTRQRPLPRPRAMARRGAPPRARIRRRPLPRPRAMARRGAERPGRCRGSPAGPARRSG